MVAAARSAGKLLMVAHVLPFFPEFRFAAEAIRGGQYGKLLGGPLQARHLAAGLVGGHRRRGQDRRPGRRPAHPRHALHRPGLRRAAGRSSRPAWPTGRRGPVPDDAYLYGPDGPAVTCSSGAVAMSGRPFVHGFEIYLEKATLSHDSGATPLTVFTADGKVDEPGAPGGGDPIASFAGKSRRPSTASDPAGNPTCSAASSPATPWCMCLASASPSGRATRSPSADFVLTYPRHPAGPEQLSGPIDLLDLVSLIDSSGSANPAEDNNRGGLTTSPAAGGRGMSWKTGAVAAVAAVAVGLSGCTTCHHRAAEWSQCSGTSPEVCSSQRSRVHVFLIGGLDVFDDGGLRGLRDAVNAAGFSQVYCGQAHHGGLFAREMRRIACDDPAARFILVGYGTGASRAVNLAAEARCDGSGIDGLVLLDPHPDVLESAEISGIPVHVFASDRCVPGLDIHGLRDHETAGRQPLRTRHESVHDRTNRRAASQRRRQGPGRGGTDVCLAHDRQPGPNPGDRRRSARNSFETTYGQADVASTDRAVMNEVLSPTPTPCG